MPSLPLDGLRSKLAEINHTLLELLNHRADLVLKVQRIKDSSGIPTFDPAREQQMLEELVAANLGPFSDQTIRHLFKEIFRASVALMERQREAVLRVSRGFREEDLVINIKNRRIGAEPIIIAGPCAIESEQQLDQVARALSRMGVHFLRGGTFKPRSSPYSFQGLGEQGLKILRETALRYDMVSITEVMDTRTVPLACEYTDILQVGARNMHNTSLLREVGATRKPVFLKRGLAATIDELLFAAEYILSEGNENVILCERGIRTFEQQTRNTLDISAIPLLKQKSFLPVIVDVSHAAGRKDILAPLAKASLAAGANGVMVEVHPFPALARSDSQQQLDLEECARFLESIGAGITNETAYIKE